MKNYTHIAVDENDIAIQGLGVSEEDAIREAIHESGIMQSLGLSYEEAAEKFRVYPAKPELIKRVLDYGGGISWDVVDGVACLPEDEE